MHAQLTDGYI